MTKKIKCEYHSLWNKKKHLISIEDLARPTILVIINGNVNIGKIIHAKEGTSAVIECSCTGNPEPDVYITSDDERGDKSGLPGTKSEYVYSFQKLECEHTKEYRCDAYNDELNHTSSSIHMFVECKY